MKKNIIRICNIAGIIAGLAAVGYLGGILSWKLWKAWEKEKRKVVIPRYQRSEIYDRNGTLLIGNRKSSRPNQRLRYAAIDGKFAAGLLGFTEFSNGKEVGKSGIEKMIDRKNITGKVTLALDCGIQKIAENWMEQLSSAGKFNHIYVVCINSQGELLATAQRPVLDINNRQRVNGGTVLFPAVYVFPVQEKFMNLLGSSSSAVPAEKEKFGFHKKIGIFTPEARGRVKGINASAEATDMQTATAFNYLLAYIGVAEKKTAPQLHVFSNGKQSAVVLKKKIEWIATSEGEKDITVLGKGSADDGSNLYILLCIEPENPNDFTGFSAEIKKL